MSSPVRIVGGGMMGLTVAVRLARLGHSVVVHEAVPALGGLSAEDEIAGTAIERYYHCVLPTDTALLDLLEEVGLTDAVGWNRTRTGFFTGERQLEMTTGMDFLRFPAIGLVDRARLAWTILYCGLNSDWRRLDREPIGPFLRRHGGRRLFERIWEPLLLAKLGPDYDRFAASFIWATVARMLSARKAKGRSEKLGYVKGHYGRVFAALRADLEAHGGAVDVGAPVTAVDRDDLGWNLTVRGERHPASGVVLCVPAPVATKLLPSGVDAGPLAGIDYLGVLCEALLLRRPVTPYYVLNLTDRSLPFTGVIETSNLIGTDELDGRHLVYLPRYRSQDHPDWDRTDEDLHADNLAGLRRVEPGLEPDDVIGWRVFRARFVQPVHPVGYGDRLPPLELADGLAYLSTAQIHPWPVFNDEVVRHVDRSLPSLTRTLGVASPQPAGAFRE